MKQLLLVLNYIGSLIYIISFIIAVIKTRKCNNYSYMSGFYWYLFVAIIVIFCWALNKLGIIQFETYVKINLISFIYHYYFFARFIAKVILVNHYPSIFKVLHYTFFILTIFTSVFTVFYMEYRGMALTVANIGLIVLSLFYYNYLFEEDSKINLYKVPAFWVITGIVLGMSFNIPFHSLSKQLLESVHDDVTYLVLVFGALGYLIMHLFFIKASLLCSIQTSEK